MANSETRQHLGLLSRLRKKLLAVALLAAAIALSFFLGAVFSGKDSQPKITTDLIGQQISDIQELATVEYRYTNMGRFENRLDFYGWQVPLTRKSFIISYDGIIKAGVDLNGISINMNGTAIAVALPKAEILSHEIPEDTIQVFDETRNIFNPIQIEDYTNFTKDQKLEVETKAIENGLLGQASERACAAVKQILSKIPGMEKYKLTVTIDEKL